MRKTKSSPLVTAVRRAGSSRLAVPGEWRPKTFEVELSRLQEFMALVDALDVPIKVAHDQALALWVARNKKKAPT